MPASLPSIEFESETQASGNPDSVKKQHALDADRQAVGGKADRDRRCRQAGQSGNPGPCQLIGISVVLAVDVDAARFLLRPLLLPNDG
jgi:hypothetical protein